MADNNQDSDEYKFDELDSFDHEPMDHTEYDSETTDSQRQANAGEKKNVLRNALITLGVVVLAILIYHFGSGLFSRKTRPISSSASINPTPAPKTEITPVQSLQPAPAEIPPQPIQQPTIIQEDTKELQQKIDSIESNQRSVQSEVSSVNQQVSEVNNNVNGLSSQISKLNQMITDLNNQVIKQTEEINVLMVRTQPKPIKRIVRLHFPINPQIVYHLNAVIPGRAWLIGTNGSTLTVREGTPIAGYGVVKLIDSIQGRILTSSGRVIRFSQEDS